MALEEIDITASGRLSATTMSADTVFVGGNQLTLSSAHLPILTADTFYGNTIYSGGTDLYDIFITSAETGVQNLIDVGKSGNVAFNSIKAAVDSITGNSSTNRYVIRVAPGKYKIQFT
jgi:pectin methylesterase-like acyl-CoA thioesterase